MYMFSLKPGELNEFQINEERGGKRAKTMKRSQLRKVAANVEPYVEHEVTDVSE